MARRANLSAKDEEDDEPHAPTTSTRRGQGRVNVEQISPSPTASFSSDKENRETAGNPSRQNGKSRAMPPPQLPVSDLADRATPGSNKRRRLSERDAPNASQSAHARKLAEIGNTDFYDPDQSMNERRAVRKDFRDLSRELTGWSSNLLL